MHLIGVYLMACITVDNFTNDLCAKLPPHANSPSPELALEFAPLIHPVQKGAPEPNRFIVKYTCICGVYARQRRRRRLASSNTMSTPNPHHGQNATVLLSRLRVFGGRWPGVAFLILALSGNLALVPIAPGTLRRSRYCILVLR